MAVTHARRFFFAAFIAFLALAGSASDAMANSHRKLDRALSQVVDSSPDGSTYQVIVRATPGSGARLRKQLAEENIQIVAEHPDAVTVELSAQEPPRLALVG